MAQINDYYYEDLDPESLEAVIKAFREGSTPPPGSRRGRRSSEPQGGPLTLLDPKLYDGSAAQPIKALPNAPAPPEAAAEAPKSEAHP
jgi:NADH-quinone oxidoreductase subunit E